MNGRRLVSYTKIHTCTCRQTEFRCNSRDQGRWIPKSNGGNRLHCTECRYPSKKMKTAGLYKRYSCARLHCTPNLWAGIFLGRRQRLTRSCSRLVYSHSSLERRVSRPDLQLIWRSFQCQVRRGSLVQRRKRSHQTGAQSACLRGSNQLTRLQR